MMGHYKYVVTLETNTRVDLSTVKLGESRTPLTIVGRDQLRTESIELTIHITYSELFHAITAMAQTVVRPYYHPLVSKGLNTNFS